MTRHIIRPIPYLIDDQIILPKRESSKELAKYGSGKRIMCKSLCQLIFKTIFHFKWSLRCRCINCGQFQWLDIYKSINDDILNCLKARPLMEYSSKITDFENIENIVCENYFIFRPFEWFKRKWSNFIKELRNAD